MPTSLCCGLCSVLITAAAAAEPPPTQLETHRTESLRERLTEREDKRRPDHPHTIDLAGRPLTLSGELVLELGTQRAPGLGGAARKRSQRVGVLELEAFYPFDEHWSAFAQLRLAAERERVAGSAGGPTARFVERGEFWLHRRNLRGSGVDVDIGRLKFEDERRWWWDEELDALRASYDVDDLEVIAALAREQARVRSDRRGIDPERQRVRRWLAQATWSHDKAFERHLMLLHQRDRSAAETPGQVVAAAAQDESDVDGTWFGIGAHGRIELGAAGRLDHRFDGALLRGRERRIRYGDEAPGVVDSMQRHRLRGWAFDAGLRWTLSGEHDPRLFAGFAQGSGGAPDAATDRNFRQTGLQANEAGNGGVKRYPHYGVLLEPELSNLRIRSLGAGLSILDGSSIDLVLHRYRQQVPSPQLRGAHVSTEPAGRFARLGTAIDLVLALDEWQGPVLKLIASRFHAGPAFGALEGRRQHLLLLELTLPF
ncbi:hypothetical protein HLB44_27850 [Aquincola sp. S2]|uniref:Alginate export domain-containing protein n=2 Tax=Pseudaquabacterium terrae TaxID=2732868 RepID=A0ABX2EQT5_9BURK|nr:hypothetical protein [Aquabacterium terrae]